MKYARIQLLSTVILIAFAFVVFAACAPAATPVPPTAVPTNPPPPTAVPPTQAPAAGATAAPAAAKPVTLQLVKNNTLGTFLADGDGNTLYLFTQDTPNTSSCYDKCLTFWPAVLPQGDPTLKDGVDKSLIGTTQRTDGSTQLTYNSWPLYYFAKDKKPGDVTGQAVAKTWWVVSGEGNAIKPAGLTVVTNDKFGKILADEKGRTLYMFTKDTKDTSNCYEKCEAAWPPQLSVGAANAGDGVTGSMIGSTTRKDGSTQVTYNGMPLYYYAKDAKPGDATGQNVGTVWFVVAPDGTVVKTAP